MFLSAMEHSDWAGLCLERMGLRPLEHEVKGEVSSWKYKGWDRKGRGLLHWDSGAWEINVTALRNQKPA